MFIILLVIIYLSFISLGLPDTVLGTAWPSMHGSLGVPVSYAGMISLIIAGGTILSSMISGKVIRRFGTGMVTTVSVGMTAFALLGFSLSHSFILICFMAVPFGLGAGSVDTALNHYVAVNYKAKHMNWLHCFWGIGATLGPYIMGLCLTSGLAWNSGYRVIFIIQIVLTGILIFSLPLWEKNNKGTEEEKVPEKIGWKQAVQTPGVKTSLMAFFAYCGVEVTAGFWGSSFLVMERGVSPAEATKWMAFFYLGITGGRLVAGFVTLICSNRQLIRGGLVLVVVGLITLFIGGSNEIAGAGFICMGIGCAPIFPALIHDTPKRFGNQLSGTVMGFQMSMAYFGATIIPPIVGVLVDNISPIMYLAVVSTMCLLLIVLVERLHLLYKPVDHKGI